MLLKILLIILCCYAFISIVMPFIFIVLDCLAKPILQRTVWRDDTKVVTEETVSASLSKALKNYNKYFEKY